MSGLLRRIKRAPAAGDQAPAEGTAAATTGAPSTAEPAPGAAPPAGSVLPPGSPTGGGDGSAAADGTGAAAAAGAAESPSGATDPALPAGVDPAEAAVQPPKGRRGRLRKRLRYLRRARELMLRDLGGVLYEVYRTGSGRVEAHAAIIGPKISRLAALDSEAHALEAALGAPRGQAVMFEPGVGGACAVCGELYASGALFCSNCGTATKAVPAHDSAASGTGAPAAGTPLIASAPPEARTAELGAQGSRSLGLARAEAKPGAEPEPEQQPAESAAATGAAPPAPATEPEVKPEQSPNAPGPGAMNGHQPGDHAPGDSLAARETRP